MGEPLVTCVMPTADRRAFVAQSIWYFLRQDYGPRELVVVDDGGEDVAALVPADERIRYVRLDRRHTLGAKLNIGCGLARGELVAHWDDDDWIGPDRLRRQVDAVAAGADACGLGNLLVYRLDTGQAWLQQGELPAPGTLVYRRELWERSHFAEDRPPRDADLVRGLGASRLRALDDGGASYVAVVHAGNVGRARPGGVPAPVERVAERLGPDRDFYVNLRNGGPAPLQTQRRPRGHTVTVAAPLLVYDGYGSMAEYLVRGLARAGASVNVVPLQLDLNGMSDELRDIVRRSQPLPEGPVLYFCWPRHDLDRFRGAADLFVNTMWETSRLPAEWPTRLNEARAVIVPTTFVARVCRDSGVDVPVEVVPEGIDPDVYGLVQRPEREGLTTLAVSTFVQRKNIDVAIAAWKRAFEGDPAARLIVKARFGYRNWTPDDPRITLVDENETTRGIAHWYAEADVLLALGSEGFGLPLVEGMATGLPVIALDSEGQHDVCTEARDLVLAVPAAHRREYDDGVFGRCGVHGRPDVEDVAARLRWVDSHRDEARAIGRAAAEWAPRARNVWDKGPAVLDVMERTVRPKRPLRRVATMWVPSFGTACGIAEHGARLAERIPGLRVTAGPPDLRGVRVLHVQHEGALFEDGALLAVVQEAKAAGIPVVVEEHTVTPVARSFEREVDLLVATTAAGVAQLRARLPDKWIEHVPLGCPTWFPPRKQRPGRTIGAYGLLAEYKGFWELLRALPRIDGAELLLLSHDRHGWTDARWAEESAGLPVRRVPDFLPEAEAARVLAAEADVLVYWYADTPHAAASGATRLGLSTGVPVLTSATRWFSELRDVTYQPEDLVEGVERLLSDAPLRKRLTASARAYCDAHSWERTAGRLRALWRTLEST